jgi:O-antigen/teichoic acid export membrane protein
VICKLTLLLAVIILLLALPAPALAFETPQQEDGSARVWVYYAGPEGSVLTALNLAENFSLTENISRADVIVLNGVIPNPDAAAQRVKDGAGLILILDQTTPPVDLQSFLGTAALEPEDEPLSLVPAKDAGDPLIQETIWTGAPQIRERVRLTTSESFILQPLVEGYEDGSLVLGSGRLGAGQMYVFTAALDDSRNPQIQEWTYFNYTIYHLVMRAAGQTPLSFAQYPGSPVPHRSEQLVISAVMGLLVLLSLAAFIAVRRYSLAHPEALDVILINKQDYAARESGTRWEETGFHRPLGGFMLALMLGLVIFIPMIIYQNLILPQYILPSAQALGIWGRVTQAFNFAWQLFDMGTSVAFIKYLSQYRVDDPRKGFKYGQVFVWWQMLSGAIQVALIVALSSTFVPKTAYAIYAWSIIIHALIQIPGFYQVFRHAFLGLQRFDYGQILDMGAGAVFMVFFQPIFVTLMLWWGRAHPVFGGSMGGLLGMGVAAYMMEAAGFVIGYLLFRRLGYNVKVLFMAHFDREVIWNSFKFGLFEMLGSIAWAFGQMAEIGITQARLVNYAEIWGNWGLATNFIYAFQVMQTLFSNLVASISEAISHGRKVLGQYYAVQAYKYGGMISAFIMAVLLAVADRFILGASGPEFKRAAVYAVPLIIWGAIQYPSWVGDTVQLGANKPYLKSILVTGEQIIRVTLALIFLQRLQIYALIVAYFIGLLGKDIVAYFVNNKLCFKQRFYVWQSLAAPLLAGGVHFIWLRSLTSVLWKGDQVTSILIFFIGILISYPVYAFLYGLFGGWDDATLDEFKQAVPLSSFMKPLSWLFWASTTLGARISPLHNRFPIDIREAALDEARSLDQERIDLLAASAGGASTEGVLPAVP